MKYAFRMLLVLVLCRAGASAALGSRASDKRLLVPLCTLTAIDVPDSEVSWQMMGRHHNKSALTRALTEEASKKQQHHGCSLAPRSYGPLAAALTTKSIAPIRQLASPGP